MPFILEDNEEDQQAHTCLKYTNVAFCIITTLSISANEVWRIAGISHLEATLIRIRMFDILPYTILVCILIFSICKIKWMIRKNDLSSARNDLIGFIILCFVCYALNWAFILPVEWFYESDGGTH